MWQWDRVNNEGRGVKTSRRASDGEAHLMTTFRVVRKQMKVAAAMSLNGRQTTFKAYSPRTSIDDAVAVS